MQSVYSRVLKGVEVAFVYSVNPAARRLPRTRRQPLFHAWLGENFHTKGGVAIGGGFAALAEAIDQALKGKGDFIPTGPQLINLLYAHQALQAATEFERIGRAKKQEEAAFNSRKLQVSPEIEAILAPLQWP
ncbi:hypothetical protein KUW15_03035 [Qipengyuania aquimaris]|uniref:hypothetical protein n=1 Tax=Qipengyuania aquimaris TaxID=255984 RepID=UPI001C98A526|nr:hypothetical protein [Qipengyuania aquimaris]MBY6127684.1 hypothetical protein [Qipengyuania aquimaris]